MKKKFKSLVLFYFILAIAWFMTEYREPQKDAGRGAARRKLPAEKPYDFPGDYTGPHKKLAAVFGNVTSMFTGGNIPVLALPSFSMASGDSKPVLLNLVTESAYFYLHNDQKIRVVRRDYSSGNKSRIKAGHILIGRVSAIGNQIRITVRIQDINTGEILDDYDCFFDKAEVKNYL